MEARMLTPQRCLFFHRWRTVHDTGFTLYQECEHCESRKVTQPKTGGYQPINTDWLAGMATNDRLRSNNNYIPDSPHNTTIPTGEPGVIRRDVGLTDNTRDGGEE